MDEKIYKCIRETLDSHCEKCLWYGECAESQEEETCTFFTSYTNGVEPSDELDEDERCYFDELAYRQRAYAAIVYSMREE